MTALALGLILSAAVVHASWNYFLKRSGGGVVFVWLFAAVSALFYAPLVALIAWWQKPELGWPHYGLMLGTGPLITVLCAVLLLGEQPSMIAVAGALLIGAGAIALAGDPRELRRSGNLRAVGFALLTGCMIASYTLVDKIAVAVWLIPPLVQDWATNLGRLLLMTPMLAGRWHEIVPTWRRARTEVLAVAVLCPLLAEGDAARRLAAAAAMVCGIACLALG
jgi:drug/metabolite transporter (DMT)-like permease